MFFLFFIVQAQNPFGLYLSQESNAEKAGSYSEVWIKNQLPQNPSVPEAPCVLPLSRFMLN